MFWTFIFQNKTITFFRNVGTLLSDATSCPRKKKENLSYAPVKA